MSCYRCACCDEYRDADFHGINEHPKDEWEAICDNCCEYFDDKDEGDKDE